VGRRALVAAITATALACTASLSSRVTVPTATDRPIAGVLYGTGEHLVIIPAHGGYSTLDSWAATASALRDSGFRVLVVEPRAASDLAAGRETPCLYDEKCLAQDLLAAMRYARGRGATRISFLAGSVGGAAAAEASTDSAARDVEGVILLAPSPISAPERMAGRKLFVTARDDANSAGPRLPGIQTMFDRAQGPKQLLLLEGSLHAQRVLAGPDGALVLREIVVFLRGPLTSTR
jgi:pimeloyl-ACP methyl ester carboxylesterase